eukprot:TRINITY_DN34082_c0_g1_i6.p1 TRINITY_DN34082_c0_g1~~TRINITY_DN34082_c0_g1_i6.p1  ORF type:complete len:435 (+),score=70.52 TRINITY_DN34082_c0_g1_i6:60-1364(+)
MLPGPATARSHTRSVTSPSQQSYWLQDTGRSTWTKFVDPAALETGQTLAKATARHHPDVPRQQKRCSESAFMILAAGLFARHHQKKRRGSCSTIQRRNAEMAQLVGGKPARNAKAAGDGSLLSKLTIPLRRARELLQCTGRALQLVWVTSRALSLALAVLTVAMGVFPGFRALVTKKVIDAVVAGANLGSPNSALVWLGVEASLIICIAGARRSQEVAESFLGTLLGHRVNVMILNKALELQLTDFEDSAIYDKLTRARREASRRPLSLAKGSFQLIRNALSLFAYGALLCRFSGWAVILLLLTAVPPFFAEVKFAGDAFQLSRRQTSGFREQIYLERVLAMDAPAKEVKLFELGGWMLRRYCAIFDSFFKDTRSLAMRKGIAGFLLELVSSAGLYVAYGWVAAAAVGGSISLGDMTMYFLIFKEGQQVPLSAL